MDKKVGLLTVALLAGCCSQAGAEQIQITENNKTLEGTYSEHEQAGSAVFNFAKDVTVKNATFANNKATDPAFNGDGTGGALNNGTSEGNDGRNASIVVIKKSEFRNNTVAGRGGGALANDTVIKQGIIDSRFENNKALFEPTQNPEDQINRVHGQGGAIYNFGQINGAGLKNVVFVKNSSVMYGGAVVNWGKISNITNSRFEENITTHSPGGDGGAIGNGGEIGTIDNTLFLKNTAQYGGAISSKGTIKTIKNSKFTSNKTVDNGGAIFLSPSDADTPENDVEEIQTIYNTEFLNNEVSSAGSSSGAGGAIFNTATIGVIEKSSFKGNVVKDHATLPYTQGGAIYNENVVKQIKNTTFDSNEAVLGGAIFNAGTINDVSGSTFNDNKSKLAGGAIVNLGYLKNISDSTFTNNIAHSSTTDEVAQGGALFLGSAHVDATASISNSTFEGNQVKSDNSVAQGGALYIGGDPTTITDTDFKNNRVEAALDFVSLPNSGLLPTGGGAIMAVSTTLDIVAKNKDVEFSGNKIKNALFERSNAISLDNTDLNSNAYQDRKIVIADAIDAFDDDSAIYINKSTENQAYKGEVVLNNELESIGTVSLNDGVLTVGAPVSIPPEGLNYAASNLKAQNLVINGGVLNLANGHVEQVILDESLDFAGETNLTIDADISGANPVIDHFYAPEVETTSTTPINIQSINLISESDSVADGTVADMIFVANADVSDRVKAPTVFTSSNRYDTDVTYNNTNTNIAMTKKTGQGGLANATGFAPTAANSSVAFVSTDNTNLTQDLTRLNDNIDSFVIDGNSKEITSDGKKGFDIGANQTLSLKNVAKLSGFSSENGAIHSNGGTVKIENTLIEGNNATGNGGAISALGGNIEVVDTSFANNSAAGKGGAIYAGNGANVSISAATTDVSLEGNTANSQDNAIYMDGATDAAGGTLSLTAANGKKISLSSVSGTDKGYSIEINKNAKEGGIVEFKNKVTNATANGGIHLYGGTLHVAKDSYIDNNALSLHGCALDMMNNAVGLMSLQSLSLENTTDLHLDVDLANATMDRIKAGSYSGAGKLNVNQFNVLTDTNEVKTSILFAGESLGNAELADKILTGTKEAKGPVYVYDVTGRKDGNNYTFDFSHGGHVDKHNPVVFIPGVAAQLGGYANQLNIYQTAFGSMDSLITMTPEEREALKNQNKYAFASDDVQPLYSTGENNNMIGENTGIWFKPYTSIESVNLKKGPKVDNFMYGGLVGLDTGLKDMGDGWSGIANFYGGYIGSRQKFQGINMYQNGGTAGMTGMLFKNNFFGGLTANLGGSSVSADNDRGKDEFGMFTTGVALKGGYNWNLADGKFVIQPNLTTSYSYINTANYDNSYDVRVRTKGLNAIQIAPGLKLIGNLKNHWQPYAGVSFMWNLLDREKVTVADTSVPRISVKPYIEYGVGVQKKMGDRFTGYGEVTARNVGRTGVAFGFGGRWDLGE